MLQNNRVIFSDNGTISDLSPTLNDFTTGSSTLAVVALEDALYLGSDFSFNHRHLMVSTANANTSAVSKIKTWDGVNWQDCVNVVDMTSVGGKTLAQSGIISWTPDKTKAWQRMDTVQGTTVITGLQDVTIYDLFWVKITFSADFSNTTAVKYIGHKFSKDADLEVKYPDLLLSAVLTQFKAGKTNWDEQTLDAAEFIINDLRSRGVICSPSQILNWEMFKEASVAKLAEFIFSAFGQSFEIQKTGAKELYRSAMNSLIKHIDENNNGILDVKEMSSTQGWLKR